MLFLIVENLYNCPVGYRDPGVTRIDGSCAMVFWVDVLVYVELNGNIELFSGLESDIVVTQFPRYTSQNGLDKPV